jgi:hypothetical protein
MKHLSRNSRPVKYYLAYGSNLNVEQMTYRCPDAKPIGSTQINDYRLLFKGSRTGAYLTIEAAPGYKVPVGVWMVSEDDEAKLDRYEGYPHFYYKKQIPLLLKGKIIMAFVYIMHEEREIGNPSEFYIKTCTAGYEAFKFDMHILQEAIEYSRKNAKQPEIKQIRWTNL